MADGRQHIVNQALKLVGAHYLWGAAGNHPGSADGAFYRKSAAILARNSLDPDTPCVFAAQCTPGTYTFVCAGRVDKVPGGRPAYPTDWDLIEYLDKLRGLSKEFWDPFYSNFTPRVCQTDDAKDKYHGKLVWGEDCRYHRHFDCIHFINYVLSLTIRENWQLNIDGWIKAGKPIPLNDPVVPGDIVAKDSHHIGFLAGDPHDGYIVQAQDHATGVHRDERYRPISAKAAVGGWNRRCRLDDGLLLN